MKKMLYHVILSGAKNLRHVILSEAKNLRHVILSEAKNPTRHAEILRSTQNDIPAGVFQS